METLERTVEKEESQAGFERASCVEFKVPMTIEDGPAWPISNSEGLALAAHVQRKIWCGLPVPRS